MADYGTKTKEALLVWRGDIFIAFIFIEALNLSTRIKTAVDLIGETDK